MSETKVVYQFQEGNVMGTEATVKLSQRSSERPLDRGKAPNGFFRRSRQRIADFLVRATESAKPSKKRRSSRGRVIKVDRDDWESENPEAQAFLKSAFEQEPRLENEGLIRRHN